MWWFLKSVKPPPHNTNMRRFPPISMVKRRNTDSWHVPATVASHPHLNHIVTIYGRPYDSAHFTDEQTEPLISSYLSTSHRLCVYVGTPTFKGKSPFFPTAPHCPETFHHIGWSSTEGNGNPLQCSCLENPRDGGAWWAAVYGVAQSWTRLKWLSSS